LFFIFVRATIYAFGSEGGNYFIILIDATTCPLVFMLGQSVVEVIH